MRASVIDLIIRIAKDIHSGSSLQELDKNAFSNVDTAERSAAYSWIMQKIENGELSSSEKTKSKRNLRVLHIAERSMITTEAYGYLLELYNLGLINHSDLESIIESFMMNAFEKVTLEKMKETVARVVFGKDDKQRPGNVYLKGNERIN
ncbi:MAG: DUF494 family protein [Balneolales bacterium]|nr:DUF494 family protein [Balneolales bacterium]